MDISIRKHNTKIRGLTEKITCSAPKGELDSKRDFDAVEHSVLHVVT